VIIIVKHCQRKFNFNILTDNVARHIAVRNFKFDVGCATTCLINNCENSVRVYS